MRDFFRRLGITRFIERIHNLLTWFPIIWNDHQWDYVYLYEILHKKLELMENFYRSGKAYSVDSIETADSINYSKIKLHKLIKDPYLSESLKEFNQKYPDIDYSIKTKPYADHPGWEELYDDWTEEQHQEFHKYNLESYKEREKDVSEVFDNMKKKVETWWD